MDEKEICYSKRTGFSCPWNVVQILTWLMYVVCTGWAFYLTGSDRMGLSDGNIPLFVKIIMTIVSVFLTFITMHTDPTDELFYADWNPKTDCSTKYSLLTKRMERRGHWFL